jgi:hypothetical protein
MYYNYPREDVDYMAANEEHVDLSVRLLNRLR